MTEHTYDLRLGMLNTKRVEPIVEAGGDAWASRDGVPVLVPDSFESKDSDVWPTAPLPAGTVARRIPGGEEVIIDQ